ncbi:hypothetical protein HOP61_17885 [Halomonas daqingensis]|uniref:Uncharacterized protein n=1 Tax=Billgrantia desiderata TaxID=52021 RepID=A0AAW4YXL8_9GAMM|nr:hypothetical protein [Halomonas desiderata]MCE8053165.1 hypothetical protein [Halomonas desiderata]
MKTTCDPNARVREETFSAAAQAHHAASLVAIEIEAALVQRLMRGGNANCLASSLLAVIEADRKQPASQPRRFSNLGMPEGFWQEVRKRWESDPRDGYAWLSKELNGEVSNAAIRKHAIEEGWSKA